MKNESIQCSLDIILAVLIIGVSLVTGFCIGVGWLQDKAAEAGVGHYTVNSTNGVTQFQFKTK